MIDRPGVIKRIKTALSRSRVVALIGPRQVGKTTLARQFVSLDSINYFDLEDPVSLARLDEPMTALRDLRGLVVIDEIQRRGDLFPILRVLTDRVPLPARFLILGSASPDWMRGSSESLAGRVEFVNINGLSLPEVGYEKLDSHWLRGGFPLSFLAKNESDSFSWRENFTRTLMERDLPQWGVRIPAASLLRFWRMVAHYHGQVWNAADLSRSLGISQPTARSYLDILEGVFMIRVLQPWYANLGKRQVKSPKLYFRDSGILHQLLGIRNWKDLQENPKLGASWEGYALEEVLKKLEPDEFYFWGTYNQAELDLFIIKHGHRYGVEFKYSDAPVITPSMKIAINDLALEKLFVVYPGVKSYPLADNILVLPITQISKITL
jgi:predicted AAA+ superfamily ATPase